MAGNESTTGEFEREPVPESHLLGPGKFWGMYAGEHCAGTEFMIGPLFLGAGASLQDLVLGLLLGNILAVLTWRYLVVPIAMAKRMTIYYQLERIAGGSVAKLYNVVNGVEKAMARRIVVVVGAGAGIGKETAHRLAEEGAHVVCADLNAEAAQATAEELTAKHGQGIGVAGSGVSGCGPAIGVGVDITDRESIRELLKQATLAYGGLDHLIVTAGVFLPPDREVEPRYTAPAGELSRSSTAF